MNKGKIPIVKAVFDPGIDGRDGHYTVKYECPECGQAIRDYKSDEICYKCGTLYNWPARPPRLVESVDAVW